MPSKPSKESLIKKLYEESMGLKSQPNVSRHVQNTNTLLDRVAPVEKLGTITDVVEIPLERKEYQDAVSFRKTAAVVPRAGGLLPGNTIRLVEVDHLIPTGKTMATIVKEAMIGTTENGIVSGKMLVIWESNVW